MNSCKTSKFSAAFKAAFPLTLPIMAGYIVLGFGFGLLLHSSGYSFVWAFFMSLTIYAGSMQYVAVGLLTGGASLVSAALLTLMINARHLFYGISMLGKYRSLKFARPYIIFGLTDETYSLVCSTEPPEGVDKNLWYFFITLLDQCYWVAGCVLGALFGAVVPLNTDGVSFSMTALFLIILVDNLKKRESRVPALLGLGLSLICLLAFGEDSFLIPSMIAIAAVLLILHPSPRGARKEAAR